MAFTVGGNLDHAEVDADHALWTERRRFLNRDRDGEVKLPVA